VAETADSGVRRFAARFGPLLGGMLLDLVDLATFGPAGLYGGFLLGGAAGWWLGHRYGLSGRQRAAMALAAAAYSATPATETLPLGTLVGGLVQVGGRPRSTPERSSSEDGRPLAGKVPRAVEAPDQASGTDDPA